MYFYLVRQGLSSNVKISLPHIEHHINLSLKLKIRCMEIWIDLIERLQLV